MTSTAESFLADVISVTTNQPNKFYEISGDHLFFHQISAIRECLREDLIRMKMVPALQQGCEAHTLRINDTVVPLKDFPKPQKFDYWFWPTKKGKDVYQAIQLANKL